MLFQSGLEIVPIVKDIKLTKTYPKKLVDPLSLVKRIQIFAKENKLEVQKKIIKALTLLQVKCQVKNNLNSPYQTNNNACVLYTSCVV